MDKSPSQLLKPIIVDKEHWKLMDEYLAVEKHRLVTRLTNCSEQELKEIQGELNAIQKLIDMPLQLKTDETSYRR